VDEVTERRIVEEVAAWLGRDWSFRRPCWGSRRGMTARRALLESLGMVELAALSSRDGQRRFHLHVASTH
jgi:hypothetical protein